MNQIKDLYEDLYKDLCFFLKYFWYERKNKFFFIIPIFLIFFLPYIDQIIKDQFGKVIEISVIVVIIGLIYSKIIGQSSLINEWYNYQNIIKDSKPTKEKPNNYIFYLLGIVMLLLFVETICFNLLKTNDPQNTDPQTFIILKTIEFITPFEVSFFVENLNQENEWLLFIFDSLLSIISIIMITNIFHDFLYKRDLYYQIKEFDYQDEHYHDIKTNGFKNSRTGQILLEKIERSMKEFLMILDIQKDLIFDVSNLSYIDEKSFISAQKKFYICQYFLNQNELKSDFDKNIRKKFEIYFFKMIEIEENEIYPTAVLIDTLNVLKEFENEYHDEAMKFIEKYINIAKKLKEEEEVKMIDEFLKFLVPQKYQRYEELLLKLVEHNNLKKNDNMTQLYQKNMSNIMKKLKEMIEVQDSVIKKNDKKKADEFIKKNAALKNSLKYVERKIIPKLMPEFNFFYEEIRLKNLNLSEPNKEHEQYIMIVPFFVENDLVSRERFEDWIGDYKHLELKEGFFPIQKSKNKSEHANVHWLTAILFTKNPNQINSKKNKPNVNCRLINFYEWLYIVKEKKIKINANCCEWSNHLIQNPNQFLPFILKNDDDIELRKISRKHYITYMVYNDHDKTIKACQGDIITEYLSKDISFRLVYDIS